MGRFMCCRELKYSLAFIVALMCPVFVAAQINTGYFVQSSTSRHFLNPAFSPEQGYIGVPVFSSLMASMQSNLGADAFLFPKDGTTYTFLSSQVSSNEFLSRLAPDNFLEGLFSSDIIDVGFRWKDDFFWTVNAGLRGDVDFYVPYEFFSFVKNGMADAECSIYDIQDMKVTTSVYGQVSVGFSARIPSVEGLSVGGNIKALLNLGEVLVSTDRMLISLSPKEYTVSTALSGYVAGKFVSIVEDEVGKVMDLEFKLSDFSPSGYGFGVDLGVAYRIPKRCALGGLQFSASVTDLGFITMISDNITGLSTNEIPVTYDGAIFTSLKSASFTGKLEEILNGLDELVTINKEIRSANHIRRLTIGIYAGVEYLFPKDRMRVGLLYRSRVGAYRTDHELTVSWNYSPVRQFNVALSYSFLNSYKTLGWMLSFTPREGLNISLSSDYTPIYNTVHGIPVNSVYIDFSLGLSVPIQGRMYGN